VIAAVARADSRSAVGLEARADGRQADGGVGPTEACECTERSGGLRRPPHPRGSEARSVPAYLIYLGIPPFLAAFVVTALDPMGDWRCWPAGRSLWSS
jgi:hypothetical protein